MASSNSYNPPCAACKFLRRKCLPECMFAPYFPPEEPQKFANVHKIFGASNVNKLLNEVLPHQREDAVNSLAYEAEARVRDPVYGCVGAIAFLQKQVDLLQKELDAAKADLIRFSCNDQNTLAAGLQSRTAGNHMVAAPIPRLVEYNRLRINGTGGNGGGLHRIPTTFPYPFPFPLPWNDSDYIPHGGGIN